MKYRYYYNAQGTIIGFTEYKTECYAGGVNNSTGYIDSEVRINTDDYTVDLTTFALVAKNQ
jgi:hypothetical protein